MKISGINADDFLMYKSKKRLIKIRRNIMSVFGLGKDKEIHAKFKMFRKELNYYEYLCIKANNSCSCWHEGNGFDKPSCEYCDPRSKEINTFKMFAGVYGK